MKTVLLVDDDPDILRIATLALERVGGLVVLRASGGHEALRIAASETPDAILLDVMMPELDGLQTLARLQRDPRTADIPVVFLTAKTLPDDGAHLVARGALGVIPKPFKPRLLAGQLRALVEG